MIAGWGKGWEYGEPGCRLPLVQEYFHEVLCLAISIQLGRQHHRWTQLRVWTTEYLDGQ